MAMRLFVQLDADGNVVATLNSERPPGDDPITIPDGHIEVTDRDPLNWFIYKWDGTDFVERDDLNLDDDLNGE